MKNLAKILKRILARYRSFQDLARIWPEIKQYKIFAWIWNKNLAR